MEAQYQAARRGGSGDNRSPLIGSSAPSYYTASNAATAGSYYNNDPQAQLPASGAYQGATIQPRPSGHRATGGITYEEPDLYTSYIGLVPSPDQYGSVSQGYTAVDGPRFVQQCPASTANPSRAGSGGAPPAYYGNVTSWPQGSGNRPSNGMSNAMEAYLRDRNDPYGYSNGPSRRHYPQR
ncbi:unnamed protein product [Zymoseptoria tritici ST99CH_1A5]|uniref:Uncharacterized protein n=1 Tax=Zymoseptoria tritici ST99CH_1A5 TaxID=1276529 RepID=A0A1Y6L9Y9_ZYMTR|nr:unnamed protein product [Zymoseptoria tritici ST99CH_1A5]